MSPAVAEVVPSGTPFAVAAAQALPLPPPGASAGWPLAAQLPPGSETLPDSASVRLLKMYGRVFCAHVSEAARRLDLYRIFTDTVVLQHSYELPSSRLLRLSVVDNVLVAHQPAGGAALLIDVCADDATPLVAPHAVGHLAPLRRPRQLEQERQQQAAYQFQRQSRSGLPATTPAARRDSGERGASSSSAQPPPSPAGLALAAALPPPTAWSVMDEEEGSLLPHTSWAYHLPNLIVDPHNQVQLSFPWKCSPLSVSLPSVASSVCYAFSMSTR
jgi:hypothetical protein